ncbi:MAG: hypothetical protein U9R60_05490 [Bacteroidota bacterium]|nr:hypothetical protein [Bacteroidota bacterium]
MVEVDIKVSKYYFLRQDERLGINSRRVTMVIHDEATCLVLK